MDERYDEEGYSLSASTRRAAGILRHSQGGTACSCPAALQTQIL